MARGRLPMGVDIGDAPGSRVRLEAYDRSGGRSRGVALAWRRRF